MVYKTNVLDDYVSLLRQIDATLHAFLKIKSDKSSNKDVVIHNIDSMGIGQMYAAELDRVQARLQEVERQKQELDDAVEDAVEARLQEFERRVQELNAELARRMDEIING